MSERYCMPLLVLEGVEEGLNYLLKNSNMILYTFVNLLPGEV
jgi:hypothetical protein